MITNIQGLRFLAALGACILHVGILNGELPGFLLGGTGVDLFFVISGFIMVVSSQDLFGQDGASAIFLRRRFTRIVPLYWIATLTFLGLMLWSHGLSLDPLTPETAERTIAGFFFFPINNSAYVPLLPIGWTLNHEMFFYLLFAAAIRFRQPAALMTVCAAIFALVVIGRMGIIHHTGIRMFWLSGINLEFVWGILAAVLYLHWKPRPMVAAVILLFGIAMLLNMTVTATYREFFFGIPAALILFGAVCVPQIPAKTTIGRIVNLLGDSSYALYLLHWILFWFVHGLSQAKLLVISVLLSISVRLLLEVPLLSLLRQKSKTEPPHQLQLGEVFYTAMSPVALINKLKR